MSKRDGKGGKKYPPHPEQYYVEPRHTAEQIFDALVHELDKDVVIWDASCGSGTILDVARERGHPTFGSDIVDRPERARVHPFAAADFLSLRSVPFKRRLGQRVALIHNPPYGTVRGVTRMADRFVLHALKHFADELEIFAALVPIGFLAGQDRYRDAYSKRRPAYSLICSQRPSMPRGDMLNDPNAGKGGMDDFCVVAWKRGGPYRCETIFMPPSTPRGFSSSERRIR